MASKPNDKRRRFVQEYLVDLNATQAAVRAGYSKKSAYSQGQRLLKDAEVQKQVQLAKQARSQRTEVTADWVVEQLAMLAGFDITSVLETDAQGRVAVRDLDTLPKHVTGAIESITQTSTERETADGAVVEKVRLQVKSHSKVSALRMLMDHLGMDAPKKQEHSGPDGGPMEVARLPGNRSKEEIARLAAEVRAQRQASDGKEGSGE